MRIRSQCTIHTIKFEVLELYHLTVLQKKDSVFSQDILVLEPYHLTVLQKGLDLYTFAVIPKEFQKLSEDFIFLEIYNSIFRQIKKTRKEVFFCVLIFCIF